MSNDTQNVAPVQKKTMADVVRFSPKPVTPKQQAEYDRKYTSKLVDLILAIHDAKDMLNRIRPTDDHDSADCLSAVNAIRIEAERHILRGLPPLPISSHWFGLVNWLANVEQCANRIIVATSEKLDPAPQQPTQTPAIEDVAHKTNKLLSHSVEKAKYYFEWAREHIDGARDMTLTQIHKTLNERLERELLADLPDDVATFRKYLNRAGIHLRTPKAKPTGKSVVKVSDI